MQGIPGPAGSGLPYQVYVQVQPGAIIPVFVNMTIPPPYALTFPLAPAATTAVYGKQVLQAVRNAYPGSCPGATACALYLAIWSDYRWSFYPTFLNGTQYCQPAPGGKWDCFYPHFTVRLRYPGGLFEYNQTPWTTLDYWQPIQ